MNPVTEHIESGEGQNALNAIREALRVFESIEKQHLSAQRARAERLALVTRYGLIGVVIGILVLWWLASRLLARTITGPLATLTATAQEFGSGRPAAGKRSEEHTSELQSRPHLVCRLLLEKKKTTPSARGI